MDQATVLPPHDTLWALGCPNIHPPLAQTRMVSDANSSWTLARRGRWRSGGAVTVTTSAEAVDSSIGRLSHHRMMSGNVCDGIELVRRPNNGRLSWIVSRFRAPRWDGHAHRAVWSFFMESESYDRL